MEQTHPTPVRAQQLQLLDEAHAMIRRSHLGLDAEIDRIMEAVAPWLLLNAAQERPRVLGLWGMTGTGKSSLVRALVAALGLAERTMWLDAGECRRGGWLEQHMDLLRGHLDGEPLVVVVDEFQHARTVKDGSEQQESPELRRLWELIDAGRVLLMPGYRRLEDLLDLHDELARLLDKGVVVRKGRVVRGITAFREAMAPLVDEPLFDESWALPSATWRWLRETNDRTASRAAFQRVLQRLDGPGVLELLQRRITEARTPHVFDARRALVIVLGNLDELYVMGREPLPALDPDVLLARHGRIGASGVRSALLSLFRIEQVARLGTDHIVMPPMGRDTVRTLLRREVEALADRLRATLGMAVTVGERLLDRLQQEAPIAVLGARPVVEAAQQVLPALLAQVLQEPGADRIKAIHLDAQGDGAGASIRSGRWQRQLPLRWPAARLAAPARRPEIVLRVALHEAGHVLCGVRCCGRVPLQACARTGHHEVAGFVAWLDDETPVTRARIVPHLAQVLGGWAAEELVYGADGVSAGNAADLEQASEFALAIAREQGLGGDLRYHAPHAHALGTGFRTSLHEAEGQAHRWMQEATRLARDTVARERGLVEDLARRMADAGSLDRRTMEGLLQGDAQKRIVAMGRRA